MEKITKIIVAMMLIVILIIITTVILLRINKTKIEKEEDNPNTIAFTDTEKLHNKNLFYTINDNIKQYYHYVQENNIEAISSISPKDEVILKNTDNASFQSQDMYVLDKISNITVYVYGVTRNKSVEDVYYLIVNIDYTNYTFSIINSSKEEFENAKNNQIDSQYNEDIVIQKNKYNTLEEKNITDPEILQYYFEDYKYKALYNQEEAFRILDSQYKQEKFNNDINEYKTYIANNINRFQDANLIKYAISKNGQYGTYIATDSYNNYYKIIETGINEYTIILDNYTIETEEFVNKYNQLSDKEKVVTNIDKVMKLINTKSYMELYGYLNENFKNTYFKTQEEFEKYIQEKFFEDNIVGTPDLKVEGNVYIVKVPYKESLSTAADEREVTFNIRLNKGTNFELSFNVTE